MRQMWGPAGCWCRVSQVLGVGVGVVLTGGHPIAGASRRGGFGDRRGDVANVAASWVFVSC